MGYAWLKLFNLQASCYIPLSAIGRCKAENQKQTISAMDPSSAPLQSPSLIAGTAPIQHGSAAFHAAAGPVDTTMEDKEGTTTRKFRVLKTGVTKRGILIPLKNPKNLQAHQAAKDLGSRMDALEAVTSSRAVSLNGRLMAVERAYHALEAKVDSTSQLAGHLDLYAGQLANNEAKTAERLSAMEAAHRSELLAQDAALQAKLSTVEKLFVASDAALKSLQQDLYASTSAVAGPAAVTTSIFGPLGEPPGTAILRKRLDELAADLLKAHAEAKNAAAKAQNVEDQVVATNVSLQNGVTEIMAMLLQATGPLAEAVREAAGREQMLMGQLHDMWIRMEAGACKCPAGCPGYRGGVPGTGVQSLPEVRAPPGWRAEGPAGNLDGGGSTDRKPFLSQFHQEDSHHGGGGPG